MEVHAHAHTPRKKWTHYFWEFLMLFLAVFCGFLAENEREHLIEKGRAKQYIRSFYDDMKRNMAIFSRIADFNELKLVALNNIYPCNDTVRKDWKNNSCLVELIKNSSIFITVSFSEGTIEQLKNAGGFRLMKKEDRDSIMVYDKRVKDYINIESTIIQQSQDRVRNHFSKLLDFQANKFIYSDSANDVQIVSLLHSSDKDLLNEFFNDLFRYRRAILLQTDWMQLLKEETNGLIEYFNATYHLE